MILVSDILPLSEHMYEIDDDWLAGPSPAPRLVKRFGAGKLLKEARRLAGTIEYSRIPQAETAQPVGILYREEGVLALLSWLTGLAERLRAGEPSSEARDGVEYLNSMFHDAAKKCTPILRLYEYAEESPRDLMTIVSARKSFVFWDTEMVDGSLEVLPDISVLWQAGEPPARKSRGRETWLSRRARLYERRVRELGPEDPFRVRRIERMDRLLAREAKLTPAPTLDMFPNRAQIYWRPRRLELIDVERLHRWLRQWKEEHREDRRLDELTGFVDSALREHADLLLDAFCTDSPEAI
jgi:hypothetical protein